MLYGLPTDNLAPSATISLTAGAPNASFPLTQLYDLKAYKVFKATGTSCTIHAVFGVAKTLQAIALIHTNLNGATITITNGAGLNVTMTAPTLGEDGHRLDSWKDLRGVALTTSTTWDIAITGAAAAIAIGELVLLETVRTLPIVWDGQAPEETESHPTSPGLTDYGVSLPYGFGVRAGSKAGTVLPDTYRSAVLSLKRSAQGSLKAFLIVWEDSVNDARWVHLGDDEHLFTRSNGSISAVRVRFVDEQKGLAL